MVRAAASGVIDYTRADPKDINWRMRHQLLLTEVQRRETCQFLETAHRDCLAYVSHGRLLETSFEQVKTEAADTLKTLQATILPWVAAAGTEAQPDTINAKDAASIAKYHEYEQRLKSENGQP
jgi:hypothetical protein